jgi:sugar phosphate isomerase/epimerase
MQRRDFLHWSFWVAPAAWARPPIRRPGPPRLRLGLAAYSFRQYFAWMRERPVTPPEGRPALDLPGFLDYCAQQDCLGAELTSYFFPPGAGEAFCLDLRHHAHLRGVVICGTAIGNTWTHPAGEAREREVAYTRDWIDRAAWLGAPHLRVFAGSAPKGVDEETAFRNCLEVFQRCAEYAAGKGVFLGLENHGGIVARAENLVRLVEAVDNPWVGVNFDSGNFHGPDPYAELAAIAPYAVNAQIKASIRRQGQPAERADFPRLVRILRAAGYQGWCTLEYEEREDPFLAVPALLAELRPLLAGAEDSPAGRLTAP